VPLRSLFRPTWSINPQLPPHYAVATWLFALLLVGIFCLQAREDWLHIDEQQITEARRSALFTEQTLSRELAERRRMVALFSELHAVRIRELIDSPNSTVPYDALHAEMQRFFPTAFAFTVADRQGQPLSDDFDGLVGEVCQHNIRHFAERGLGQPLFIHPHPEIYHYDIMVSFGEHIFFVSFKPDELVSNLRQNASLEQQLYLLKDDSALIELAPEGTRQSLKRENRLSEAEMSALLLRLPVKGTSWRLVVLPNIESIKTQQDKILWSLLARSIGVLVLTAIMLWLLRRESHQRFQAEGHAQAMKQLSNTDALSGLPNRRALDEALAREWQWMERSGQALTVMMIDIDHFKFYNDHLGHQQGDEAICTVARALWQVANRPRDMVGRFGGEEFLAILPDTPASAGPHLADSMHETLRAAALPHPTSPTSAQVTISVGLVTATPGLTRSPEQLVQLADQALYMAKDQGRNRTVALPESTSSTTAPEDTPLSAG
jgi:diguanylate cyclase (GGDEF)-like protein